MRGRRAAKVAAVAPLLLALLPIAGCGSRKAESEQIFAQGPLPYQSALVRAIDNRFRPPEIQARPDEPMIWFNQGKAEHTATADSGQQISFDTGTIEPGKRKQVRLKVPGTWTYHCRFHPFMKGRIEVVK